jgi:hypothetical protein
MTFMANKFVFQKDFAHVGNLVHEKRGLGWY